MSKKKKIETITPKTKEEIKDMKDLKEFAASETSTLAAEIAEINYQLKELGDRKKAAMDKLVDLCGGEATEIDGKYKLAKTTRNNVSYATMVNEMLPGVDRTPYSSQSVSYSLRVLK